jgi:ferredoxin
MHILRDENQEIEAVCGGCSSCTTCEVFLEDLACGISMMGSVSVLTSHASTSRDPNIIH